MTIKKLFGLSVAVVICLAALSPGQSQQSEFEAKIDALVASGLRDGQLIGCSALIYKTSQIIYFKQ